MFWSRGGNSFTTCFKESSSAIFSSSPSTLISICPPPSSSEAVKERGICAAPSACAASAGSTPKSSASSPTVGERPSFSANSAAFREARMESSFRERPTFTAPPSRKRRRISPRITGTAYVENLRPRLSSKWSTALTRPKHPAWKRSSYSIPRPLNRLAQACTKPMFSCID